MAVCLGLGMGLCMGTQAFAGMADGEQAQQVSHALWNAIGVSYCGDGACLFQVDHLKCVDLGARKGCGLEARRFQERRDQPGTYDIVNEKLEVRGWKARRLIFALLSLGSEYECNDERCQVEVPAVSCRKIFGEPVTYHCEWEEP